MTLVLGTGIDGRDVDGGGADDGFRFGGGVGESFGSDWSGDFGDGGGGGD